MKSTAFRYYRQENGLIKQAQDIFFVSIFDIFGSYEETVDMM